jgi:protein ImuB
VRPDEPLVTVEEIEGVRLIAALDAPARAMGLRRGQKLTDARALLPGLAAHPAMPADDLKALTALSDWCGRFSPATAPDTPEGLLLDITGCAQLWGSEDALLVDTVAAIEAWGFPCRAAVADSFGAAWAAARGDARTTIVPEGGARRFLAALPVAALRLDVECVDDLHRLGLSTVGALLSLPRADLARRFGEALITRLDQALGLREEAVAFRRPPSPWLARRAFAEPIATPEDLARVLSLLAEELCKRLEEAERGGRRFEAAFYRSDGAVARIAIALALPSRDGARIARLLRDRLETVDPGLGVDVVTLLARAVAPCASEQSRLPMIDARETVSTELAPLIDTLGNRLGFDRLWRASLRESHVPERAVARVEPLAPQSGKIWAKSARPVRLLRRPEAIEATALVPDDPPVQFRWRGLAHRVHRAEGPERIANEWWRAPASEDEDEADLIRDYYRVETMDGRRFWIFRAGLHGGVRPPRWYLHGFFG